MADCVLPPTDNTYSNNHHISQMSSVPATEARVDAPHLTHDRLLNGTCWYHRQMGKKAQKSRGKQDALLLL